MTTKPFADSVCAAIREALAGHILEDSEVSVYVYKHADDVIIRVMCLCNGLNRHVVRKFSTQGLLNHKHDARAPSPKAVVLQPFIEELKKDVWLVQIS